MVIFNFFKKTNNKLDLDKILSNERTDMAIMEIDEQLNEISDFGENLNVLNPSQQVVIIIENLEREINNGGFNQFYFNSSGNYANETIEYLKIIGANKTSEIVEKANNEWENGIVLKNRNERQKTLKNIEKKADLVWKQCDTEFNEYQDDITGLLIEFIKKNRKDFE